MLAVVAFCFVGGCRLLPPNCLAIVAMGESGRHPHVLRFVEGAALATEDRGAVVLASGRAVLLFDHVGGANRVQLLFREHPAHLLYERIGQRPVDLDATGTIPRPAGIRIDEDGDTLRGSIDVFVAQSERDDAQVTSVFGHYPRAMRVVGYFTVPQRRGEPGDACRALLDEHEESDWLLEFVAAHPEFLDRLPIIDVEYLVPTTLLHRLGRGG